MKNDQTLFLAEYKMIAKMKEKTMQGIHEGVRERMCEGRYSAQ